MMNPEKNIALVCNPTHENERALRIADSIALLLTGMDIKHSTFVTNWPENWDGITEAWVIGGDGTLNWFINHYPDIELPFSVFAGGSGNDFHWMLYGDISVEQQVELVLEAESRAVDAGVCNGKLFLNGVGIGFDGAVVKDLVGKKKLAGKASYLLSILKHIITYHERPCSIEMPGELLKQDCLLISVANAQRYGGGFKVAPKASIQDQLLDVNIVGRVPPLKRMRVLPIIEKGAHLDLPFIQYRQLQNIRIESKQDMHAHIDGEYFCEKIFEIGILPKRFSLLY